MRQSFILAAQLRENLPAVLDGSHSPRQLNIIVGICHALASELLERQWRSHKLTEAQGISETDLAYDCIAELFQRDEAGRLVQIQAYFASLDLREIGEEELLVYLRKLVYSRVNQAVFRIYHDVDPVFSRILRNVKIAVQRLAAFEEIDRFGETILAPLLCDRLQHLPIPDDQLVERNLVPVCTGGESIPEMLAKIALYLRQQDEHARMIGMMAAARTIRTIYEIKNRPLLEEVETQPAYELIDTASIVRSACAKLKQEMFPRYVQKGKVTEFMFQVYFDVIESNLISEFTDANGDSHAYFELLKQQVPELTLEEYRVKHRAKVEYLGALAGKRATKALKTHIM